MKIIIIFLTLLLSFGLCSCANNLQTKISTEKPSDTKTVTEDTNTEKPTDAELISIVFMGETIIAPGYYPGVPDVYIPVLDDLYLDGELSYRYNTLNYEGKITQEIMRESENVEKEIQRRGYLPYLLMRMEEL